MVLIPIVTALVEVVQTRYVIAFGFLVLGFGLIFGSIIIPPDVDFPTLVMARTIQSAGFGFLLVPINTVAFLTLPRELNNDGAALFAMFRNVSGAIAISLATAAVTERTQVHQSYLAQRTTPLHQPLKRSLQPTNKRCGQWGGPESPSAMKLSVTYTRCSGYMYGRRPRCKRNLTISEAFGCGHVWTAPAVQEESDYQRSVRVRSCIRPLSAAVWPLALM